MSAGRRRRAFVLVTVLIVTASALLIATGLLFVAQSDAAGRALAGEEAERRAMAASALRVLAGGLDAQRERILDGFAAEVDDEYVLWETSTELALARLRPLGPAGETLVAEAGRLDLNVTDAARLAATGLVAPDVAADIVAARDARPGRRFTSVAELLAVPGVTPEVLYGPLEGLAAPNAAPDDGPTTGDDGVPRGLADVVTVWAVAPALQRDGVQRVNLDVPWSEDLGARLDDRFGTGAGDVVRQMMDGGLRFDDDRVIARTARPRGRELLRDVLDVLTTDPGGLHFGRLDLNTAAPEVLATLPGVDADAAAAIVDARAALAPDERWTVLWPVFADILEDVAYDELAGRVTTRCWTWRARIAVGTVDPDEADGPLRRPLEIEVVFDLSAPTARIAWLRDVTLLRTAALLAAAAAAEDDPFAGRRDGALGDGRTPAGDDAAADPVADPLADPFADRSDDPFPDPDEDPFVEPADGVSAFDGPTVGASNEDPPRGSSGAPVREAPRRLGRWLPPR